MLQAVMGKYLLYKACFTGSSSSVGVYRNRLPGNLPSFVRIEVGSGGMFQRFYFVFCSISISI